LPLSVVTALKQAGEEIWAAGIDDSYSNMGQDTEPLGNAFDITLADRGLHQTQRDEAGENASGCGFHP
jgi:hypothetical protein